MANITTRTATKMALARASDDQRTTLKDATLNVTIAPKPTSVTPLSTLTSSKSTPKVPMERQERHPQAVVVEDVPVRT